jgi:hypothetical protein
MTGRKPIFNTVIATAVELWKGSRVQGMIPSAIQRVILEDEPRGMIFNGGDVLTWTWLTRASKYGFKTEKATRRMTSAARTIVEISVAMILLTM